MHHCPCDTRFLGVSPWLIRRLLLHLCCGALHTCYTTFSSFCSHESPTSTPLPSSFFFSHFSHSPYPVSWYPPVISEQSVLLTWVLQLLVSWPHCWSRTISSSFLCTCREWRRDIDGPVLTSCYIRILRSFGSRVGFGSSLLPYRLHTLMDTLP